MLLIAAGLLLAAERSQLTILLAGPRSSADIPVPARTGDIDEWEITRTASTFIALLKFCNMEHLKNWQQLE